MWGELRKKPEVLVGDLEGISVHRVVVRKEAVGGEPEIKRKQKSDIFPSCFLQKRC